MKAQFDLHYQPGNDKYDLKKDLKAYIIEFEYKKVEAQSQTWNSSQSSTPDNEDSESSASGAATEGHDQKQRGEEDLYLEKYTEKEHPSFRGSFPNQKVSIEDLLTVPEVVRSEKNRVRYIHIPSNNMEWIEQVIAQYYGEERPNFGQIHSHKSPPTRSYNLLRPEYWHGQQHGGGGLPVHSRHMNPICESPSTNRGGDENSSRTLTLFMPYLHWETSRKRKIIANVIFSTMKQEREKKEKKRDDERKDRVKERRGLTRCGLPKITHQTENKDNSEVTESYKPSQELPDVGAVVNAYTSQAKFHPKPRPTRRNALASVLMNAAKLYERMALFRDEKMIEEYLVKDSPVHPRRSLDQSYYWTLHSTESRDVDQVVFRHTRPRRDHFFSPEDKPRTHKHILRQLLAPKTRHWPRACPWCEQEKMDGERCRGVCIRNPRKGHSCRDCMTGWQWTRHTDNTDVNGCEHCRDDIQRLTRAVMVDQLWMWVLDEQTILTCYPRRYGHNKPDPSGVHKSIRTRLKAMPRYELRSAYDLALIILDECSNTFFDRTKTRDNQPRLTDIFSESIGRIAYKHTVLFDHLVHWTKEVNRVCRSHAEESDTTRLHVPLLDIRREGKLQREIKDIIDELDMMIFLGGQQTKVLKRFKRLVQQMMSPSAAYKEPDGNQNILPSVKTRTESWPLRGSTQSFGRGAGGTEHCMKKKYNGFTNRAMVLVEDVQDRIAELESLKKSALSAAENIKELLSLKQQQASVVQAFESVRQAEESVKQGRSIMMFTIVTIIFLPLSFMASVFGINAVEFTSESKVGLKTMMPIMFGVSGLVTAATLVVAFSGLVRSIIWSFFTYTSTRVAVSTGMYKVWLRWGRTSRSVDAMTIREMELMKKIAEEKIRDEEEEERKKQVGCEKHPPANSSVKSEADSSAKGEAREPSDQGTVDEREDRAPEEV